MSFLLPVDSIVLALIVLPTNHISPVLKWINLLVLSLSETGLLAAFDAIEIPKAVS